MYKGNIDPVSRKSPYSLYSLNIASFTMGAEYDQKDAQGFINLIGLAHSRAGASGQTGEMKLWGGRFEAGPPKIFERFSGSLHFRPAAAGCRLPRLPGLRARLATRRHSECRRNARTLVEAFEKIRADAREPAFFDGASDEDVHTLVIRKLKESAGAVADKIHTGRSRNDQVSLDLRLWLRDEIDTCLDLLWELMAALLGMARHDPDAIVPGYTHTRRAQPVLWPHYLLAYFEMFARDRQRLHETRQRVNVMPLGSGGAWQAADFRSIAMRSRGNWGLTASRATPWTFPATATSRSIFCTPLQHDHAASEPAG